MRWFDKKIRRTLLEAVVDRLEDNPLAETKHLKTLRPNPLAQRELRLFGKYRALFNVDADTREVTVLVVGEKRGDKLLVQGEEFSKHESHSAD